MILAILQQSMHTTLADCDFGVAYLNHILSASQKQHIRHMKRFFFSQTTKIRVQIQLEKERIVFASNLRQIMTRMVVNQIRRVQVQLRICLLQKLS